MNDAADRSENWDECPPGQLADLVHNLKDRRRKRRILGAATVVVVLVTLGIAASGLRHSEDQDFGGITCQEVQDQLKDYLAGGLDAGREEQIRQHLAECPHCGPLDPQANTSVSPTISLRLPREQAPGCDCVSCLARGPGIAMLGPDIATRARIRSR